jgi:SsrA-binding protein
MVPLIQNKKVHHDIEVLEELEAGIELRGYEVRALRTGLGSLRGAHAIVRGGEVYLIGMSIPPYQSANTPASYEPERARRLLLNKKEIATLADVEHQKGLTVMPLSVYNKGTNLKVRLAIGRGKKSHDKRQTLKKRDATREIERTLKNKR